MGCKLSTWLLGTNLITKAERSAAVGGYMGMILRKVKGLNRSKKFSEVLSIIGEREARGRIDLAVERAYALRLTNKKHEAEELLTSFNWSSEANVPFLKELGHLFISMKKFEAAFEVLIRLIHTLGYESPSVYANFIKSSLITGHAEMAKKSMLYALDKWPNNKKVMDAHSYFLRNSELSGVRVSQDNSRNFTRNICDFLYFGYLPSSVVAAKHARRFEEILNDETLEVFDYENPLSMSQLLEKIIDEKVAESNANGFKVGVSSGYDSRLILSALSKVVDSNRIYPFTVGTKGNKDVTLAPVLIGQFFQNYRCRVTDDVVGASIHERYAESDYVEGLTFDAQVKKYSVTSPSSPKDGREIDYEVRVPKNIPTFNGFMGDPLSGSHLPKKLSETFGDAKDYHVRKLSQYIKGDIKASVAYEAGILPSWYNPSESLGDKPWIDPDILSYDDQLDMFYRGYQYIRLLAPQGWEEWELAEFPPAIRDRLLERRDRMILPFNDPRWIRSCLRTPLELRREQKFYKRFAAGAYPEFFQDLVNPEFLDGYDGGGATNIDWGYLWRHAPGFRSSVTNILSSLKDRDLWFDPFIAIEFADGGVRGAPALLKGLCALELNLRAGTIKENTSR